MPSLALEFGLPDLALDPFGNPVYQQHAAALWQFPTLLALEQGTHATWMML